MEMSRPGMLPRVISASVALRQLGSSIMSMASITTNGSSDAQGLVSPLRSSCWFPRAMLLSWPCPSGCPVLLLVPWWHLGPSFCLGPSLVCGPAAVGFCADVHGLCYHKRSWEQCLLKSNGCAKWILLLTSPQIAGPAPC